MNSPCVNKLSDLSKYALLIQIAFVKWQSIQYLNEQEKKESTYEI